jgi:ribosome-associated protein
MESFKIKGEYIELIKLLKATGMAENGGEAQAMVEQELVMLNGTIETRKRAKLKPGDVITCPAGKVKVE